MRGHVLFRSNKRICLLMLITNSKATVRVFFGDESIVINVKKKSSKIIPGNDLTSLFDIKLPNVSWPPTYDM